MKNSLRIVAVAAGISLASVAAQAQQNVCQANVAQVLSGYGVPFADVAEPAWQTLRWAHRGEENGPISGYEFSGRPGACSTGTLYVMVTTGCEISQIHTAGGCMIRGIPNHWW